MLPQLVRVARLESIMWRMEEGLKSHYVKKMVEAKELFEKKKEASSQKNQKKKY